MGAVSGQFGTIHIGSSELVECTGWKLSRKANLFRYNSCSTQGYKGTVNGVLEGSGSLMGKYDPDDPMDDHFEAGDRVTAKLYVTASLFYLVPMTIEQVDIEVDIDEGSIIGWEASFQTDGAWTKPTT